jgi:hypothetical protein
MERTAEDFFNMPPLKLDLSQAPSVRGTYAGDPPQFDQYGHEVAETTGNPHIAQFKQVLEEVLGGLTAATQKVIEQQTQYFDTTVNDFMTSVQNALNDIDGRLNFLSQAQAQTEEALDAFIKMWMFANTEANVDDQKAIVANFLKRGLPANDESARPSTEA